MNTNSSTDKGPPPLEEMTSPPQPLWTTEEVAKFLHVSPKTVFNLRKKGLPYVQLSGSVRFDPQEVRAYLRNNRGLSSHRLRQIVRKGDART
jgi:excisionase family DNA binding protein